MKMNDIKLPKCGIFIGSGVYPMSKDYLLGNLYAHTSWMPQSYSPSEMIQKIVDDNQGNLAQVWGCSRGYAPSTIAEWYYALDEIGVDIPEPDFEKKTYLKQQDCQELKEHEDRFGAGLVRFIRDAADKDIYTTFIYTNAKKQWSEQFKDFGEHYLGYDFGERYTFRLDEKSLNGKQLENVTLDELTDDFIQRVKEHVDEKKADGWGHVMATSCNFYIDYEVLGGADIPLIEDFAFSHLNMASALSRGLYRQHDLPMWGTHMAHEHYSWIPYRNPRKFDLLKAAMYLKYMTGAKMIINESGNWYVEACLCEDSPRHEFPEVPLSPEKVKWNGEGEVAFIPYVEEARKHYDKISYDSPISQRYRKEISDFYDFVKANGTPDGQPESTVAIAKGNNDLCNQRFNANSAIAGAFALAEENTSWFEGAPERGWEAVTKTFYPLPPVLGEHPNQFLSGAPYGQVDVVSFAKDQISAEFLNENYKALMFSGWNTATQTQYETLKKYVGNGGTLFISIPHLSTNIKRNYTSYTVDDLINKGDFSDLCGIKVKGRGSRFYWATAPRGSEELGIKFPERYGIMATCIGDIDVVDPDIEVLLVEDEQGEPVLLRRKCGKGTVYFLNSWAYPGALNNNVGPGATVDSPGLIGMIYKHIARNNRGNVWITDDRQDAGKECGYINVSYFPEAGKIYLYNIDFEQPHRCFLHQFGVCDEMELAPGEFKIIETVKQAE